MNDRTIMQIVAHPTLSELRIGKALSFLSACVWVICLLWPGETMHRPTYHIMAMFGDDLFWMFVFATIAIVQGTRLLLLSSFPVKFTHLINGAVAFVWVFTSISMLASVYPPPAAIAGEIVVTLASVWVFAHYGTAMKKNQHEAELYGGRIGRC